MRHMSRMKTRRKEVKWGAAVYWGLTVDISNLLKRRRYQYDLWTCLCNILFFVGVAVGEKVRELQRILRTLIARGSEKVILLYFILSEMCEGQTTSLSHAHAWMILLEVFFLLFHHCIENRFIFSPVLLVVDVANCSTLGICVLQFHTTQTNNLSRAGVHR